MERLTKLTKNYRILLVVYLIFLLMCIMALLMFNKLDVSLFINRNNTPFLDFFFKNVTLFGTFTLIAPIIVFQFFQKYRYALITTVSTLISFVLSQVMKRLIWYDSPRPKVFLESLPDIHYIEGVHLHAAHSFPSGHTTGAFALFMALALLNKRPVYQILFLVAAILVGYSRLYLSQHFLIDVVVGSAIGTFSAIISYYWFNNERFSRIASLDKSIKPFFRRSR